MAPSFPAPMREVAGGCVRVSTGRGARIRDRCQEAIIHIGLVGYDRTAYIHDQEAAASRAYPGAIPLRELGGDPYRRPIFLPARCEKEGPPAAKGLAPFGMASLLAAGAPAFS